MIDLRLLRDNIEALRQGIALKRSRADLDHLAQLDTDKRSLQIRLDKARSEQKSASRDVQQAETADRDAAISRAKEVAGQVKELESTLTSLTDEFNRLVAEVPNPADSTVPDGDDEADNEIVKVVGEPTGFDFPILDQQDLGEKLDIIDTVRGAKTSGSRFVYLKGAAAMLEFALIRYALDIAQGHGFTPVIPPVLVREEAMYSTGFFPAEKFEFYKAEEEDLYLVGTSEVPLAALHAGEIVEAGSLPLRYAGFSSCFRREAGTYGRDTRGAFRVHQFDKLELFSFTHPDESAAEHERLLSIEEEIVGGLGLAYRIVNVCGGELGAPAAKKYDIEVWLPSEGTYREATSCSNCTDYQARRLKTRFRAGSGTELVHTLNGTAVAATRWIVFIIENFQQADGSIVVPEALRAGVGVDVITPPGVSA